MKSTITSFGNSKGIRIPKLLLEESGLGNEVEITAKRNEIRITPYQTKKELAFNTEYLLSLSSLTDWDTPEEDEAWAHLQ